MQSLHASNKEKKLSFLAAVKRKILFWFKLTNKPVIKVYNGYGTDENLLIFGHVLKLSPLPRKKYRRNFITNTFSMLRLFMVKTMPRVNLQLEWDGVLQTTHTEDDGFFKFEWKPQKSVGPGWHQVNIKLVKTKYFSIEASGKFFVPYKYQYSFISDIDDTFLISHSTNLRRRLYVLLTKNARSRKPFEGVVNHYQQLANNGAEKNTYNSFYYISSSEWNLYDYIIEFSRNNKLPKGVYLLNQLKLFSQVWQTGQTKHATKFFRIARIIEAYPQQQYVLMGDDSQQDPHIYASVVEHFPEKIYAVYLRHVRKSRKEEVDKVLEKIKLAGVYCCYFHHSNEAVQYSKEIGLILNS